MPSDEDIFNNMPTVAMLIEIPLEVYNGMVEGYNTGLSNGTHSNSLEKWTGLLVCKGIQSVYDDREREIAAANKWINFLPNDDFVEWVQGMIHADEVLLEKIYTAKNVMLGDEYKISKLKTSIEQYRTVLNKYISYGRL